MKQIGIHKRALAALFAVALASPLAADPSGLPTPAEAVPSHGEAEYPGEAAPHEHLETLPEQREVQEVDPAALMPPHDYSVLERLVVLEGGRKKPLLTFARESLLTMGGRSRFEIADGVRVEPMPFAVSIWLSGRDWSGQPLISVDYPELKEKLDLPTDRSRFSFREIVGSPRFQELYQEMERVREEAGDEEFTDLQDKLNGVANRLTIFQNMQTGRAFAVIPHPTDKEGDWVSVPEGSIYYSDEKWADINRATVELFASYHAHLLKSDEDGDSWEDASLSEDGSFSGVDDRPFGEDFVEASHAFLQLQASLSPDVMPSEGKIKAELIYEHFGFFRWAWVLCLLSSIIVALTWSVGGRAGFIAGIVGSALALLLLVIGMGLRVYISGRAPVTNMYETVVWVAFGLIVFSLIFEMKYRCRYYLVSGVSFAAVYLILADSAPVILDPSIAPLTAVLRDNFWLTTHVLTVTISYAALGLAFALGHIVLGRQIILGPRAEDHKLLYAYIYRAMQVGLLLLIIGVILGGVWANYSWGRFWGWDPKETWSLIAILCYLFLMHGRLVGWWKGFGMSVGAVLAFQSVLMCWYGVNFVLGAGLHSYGFGTGGTGYVVGFVIVELVFVSLALLRRFQGGGGRTPKISAGNRASAAKPITVDS